MSDKRKFSTEELLAVQAAICGSVSGDCDYWFAMWAKNVTPAVMTTLPKKEIVPQLERMLAKFKERGFSSTRYTSEEMRTMLRKELGL